MFLCLSCSKGGCSPRIPHVRVARLGIGQETIQWICDWAVQGLARSACILQQIGYLVGILHTCVHTYARTGTCIFSNINTACTGVLVVVLITVCGVLHVHVFDISVRERSHKYGFGSFG